MLKHRKCPPLSTQDDRDFARNIEILGRNLSLVEESTTARASTNITQLSFPNLTAFASHDTIVQVSSRHTASTRYDRINRIFTRHNSSNEGATHSTISRLASSLISPIRSKSARSFLQTHIPRYRCSRSSSRGRNTTSNFFGGILTGSESWTSFQSTRSQSRSRDYYQGTSKRKHDTWGPNDLNRFKKLARNREHYPRPNKRKHDTWDIIDIERLKKLSILNQEYPEYPVRMSIHSAIVASATVEPSTFEGICFCRRRLEGRSPPPLRRAQSSVSPRCSFETTMRPSLVQSRPSIGQRQAGASSSRSGSASLRKQDESPEGQGCVPRTEPRSAYKTIKRGVKLVLPTALAVAVPIKILDRPPNSQSTSARNRSRSTRDTERANRIAARPPTPIPKPRSKSSGSEFTFQPLVKQVPISSPAYDSEIPSTSRNYANAPSTSKGYLETSFSYDPQIDRVRRRLAVSSSPSIRKRAASHNIYTLPEEHPRQADKAKPSATKTDQAKEESPLVSQDCTHCKNGHVSRKEQHEIQKTSHHKSLELEMEPPAKSSYLSARPDLHLKCNRGSHSSDTSSAYSGSDTMTSLHSSALDGDEVDLSGLVESIVDSDEDDLVESMESLNVRDAVRECLEKDPSERTEEDIETLLEFTQGLKAFTNITLAVRRALCSVMVFAVVDKAGTIVMSDGEELDSWSVLINGLVEIDHGNGEKEELQMGDSFGILPTMDKLYHRGVMKTKCNDCQFVCITQTDYYRIQHQGEENTKRHEEDGKVVMVTELRQIGPDTNVGSAMKRGHVVIRGTIERLLLQLVEENSMTDPTYVEDFLLTHRTFIRNPQEVAGKLLSWFENEEAGTSASPQEIRDRVTRVVLLWVNNHFTDFETDTEMMEFLETFESGLERKNLLSQLRLLHIACAAKARTRTVTLARSSRDENLNFTFVGGYERGGYGIFISKVEKNSKPDDVGLKRGDQILEVNGQSFEHVTNARALEIIMGSTHLSITVKSNLLSFKEMIQSPDSSSPRPRPNPRRICANDIAKLHGNPDARPTIIRLSSADMLSHDQVDCCPSPYRDRESSTSGSLVGGIATAGQYVAGLLGTYGSNKKDSSTISVTSSNNSTSSSSSSMSTSAGHQKGGFMTLGPKRRLQKALIKMNLLPKNAAASMSVDAGDAALIPSEVGQNQDDGRTSSSAVNNAQSSSNYNTGGGALSGMFHSRSNPDLTSTIYYEDTRQMEYPEHVLKVYKSDQTCKYLLINKETTAHEVVMLALQEFGIHETSSNFSLCEVSVGEGGMIKQRRLPEQLQNLAERIGLASRYYLKTNGITETLVPDDLALDLVRESTVHFLQLNANEVAIQLTFQDFAIFRQIESTEYVDDLFELKSKYGVPMLKQFAELVNREMFWVVTEVCSEHNIVRRMKIVKQFIKIARHCKECRNFNSMFAIVSGLGHAAVTRLRQTWEKLPSKYQKLFADLQDLMDPSRNMSKYRQLVSAEFLAQHPIIPFYPVVKKDLTFIHLGNDTRVENLINFEKLRMIAKEVRILTHMCSSTYDLLTMLEFKGQPPSSAMVALNQMSVSSGPHHIHGGSGQATVKRRKKSTAAPNPKKMFEEAQMVRRVKAYLNNMKVITDEDVLHGLSLECEPSATTSSGAGGGGGSTGGGGGGSISGGSAPNSVTIRKRHPSPTLSTTSSTSSTSEGRKGGLGPKFGTASPQAVKKILSLSEPTKTRPYQPRHPGIMLPLVGHPHTFHYALHSSISPSPSPGAHRRMGSGTGVPVSGSRAVHERSHSDTPTPLPSVDLSVESSSVTSFSNLPLRKTMTSGSVTSSDSGHGSYVQPDVHLNYPDSSTSCGHYHLNVHLPSNMPTSPKLQQRRHSAIHAPGFYYNAMTLPSSPTTVNPLDHHSAIAGRKASPTPPLLPHGKPSLDERMMGLSLQQQYHSQPPPPLPPPSLHTQQMKSANPATGGMCVDGGLSFGPASVRNLQYHPLPPPPPLAPHPTQQQQQVLQQHLQQQQYNSQYHTSRNVGHGVLMNSLVQPSKGPRYPPSYTVAAHMARLHRLGRAHSLERVANSIQGGGVGVGGGSGVGGGGNSGSSNAGSYYQHELGDEDDDAETQVSAV